MTESDYDKVLNVNLKGVFFATQEFVRHLRHTHRRGKIVNVSSVHEELPFPNFTAYCASKGGVKMLTRNLSIELGPLGININNVAMQLVSAKGEPVNQDVLDIVAEPVEITGQVWREGAQLIFKADPKTYKRVQ